MTATHNDRSIRTGCMGNVERYRVVPTPSNGGGLDPDKHISIARALRDGANYATGMAGKWRRYRCLSLYRFTRCSPTQLKHAPFPIFSLPFCNNSKQTSGSIPTPLSPGKGPRSSARTTSFFPPRTGTRLTSGLHTPTLPCAR